MTTRSEPLPAHLQQILDDLRPALEQRIAESQHRARRVRAAAVALAAVGLFSAAAHAGKLLLGEPAPANIRSEFAAVDRGMPPELRLNPDIAAAKSVATTGASTLYLARLRGGGYCMQLMTADGRGRGVGCATLRRLPIDVMVPHTEPVIPSSPVTLAGRVNDARVASLELRYTDGSTTPVAFGNEHFFVVDVPESKLALVHGAEMVLVAKDEDGNEVARAVVPADWDASPAEAPAAPIELSTVSEEDDLTKILGLRGRVTAAGATALELRYADGETVRISLATDGSFDYEVPAARRDDFMRPQRLVALDAGGAVVAERSVAAVAFWRASQRGG